MRDHLLTQEMFGSIEAEGLEAVEDTKGLTIVDLPKRLQRALLAWLDMDSQTTLACRGEFVLNFYRHEVLLVIICPLAVCSLIVNK